MRNHLFVEFKALFDQTAAGETLTPAMEYMSRFFLEAGIASQFDFTLLIDQAMLNVVSLGPSSKPGHLSVSELIALVRRHFFGHCKMLGVMTDMQPIIQLYSRFQTDDPLVEEGEVLRGFGECFKVLPDRLEEVKPESSVLSRAHAKSLMYGSKNILIAARDPVGIKKPLGKNIFELMDPHPHFSRPIWSFEVNPFSGAFEHSDKIDRYLGRLAFAETPAGLQWYRSEATFYLSVGRVRPRDLQRNGGGPVLPPREPGAGSRDRS